jgi:hypothetical protein
MSRFVDDSRELSDRINEEIEQVLSEYWPGWITAVQKGQQVALVTPRVKEKGKKPTSSFVVQLQRDRGKWYRFSRNVGGWGLQLLAYGMFDRLATTKEDWAEVYAQARQILGIEQRAELSPEQEEERDERRRRDDAARQERAATAAAEQAAKREERKQTAAEVWKATVPLAGSLGDVYLQTRGLPPVPDWPWDPDQVLRFHPSLTYELNPRLGEFPCFVSKVQDSFGAGVGVWREYLAHDGMGKAPVANSKVGLGPTGGGAVRIGGEADSIGVGEGTVTSLSAWFLNGCRKPVWACLSTSGLKGFEIPSFVRRLEIFPDGDKAKARETPDGKFMMSDRPGIAAARGLEAEAIPILGRENVSLAPEPGLKEDYNDIYRSMKAKGLL